MSCSPWLSILIPVYKAQAYVQACVQSVLAQCGEGVEILALDDCSPDKSLAILQDMAQRWPALRVERNSLNLGPGGTRNALLDAAQGDYVWFLDADDLMLPGALAALRQVVVQYQPELVLCDYVVLTKAGPTQACKRTFFGRSDVLSHDRRDLVCGVLDGGETHVWSKIARRQVWARGVRFPEGVFFEDAAITPQLALNAHHFYHCPQPWVAYRQHGDSILANMSLQKARDWAWSLSAFRRAWAASDLADDARIQVALARAAASNLHGAMRALQGLRRTSAGAQDAALHSTADALRQGFAASSPLSARDYAVYCLRQGWLGRWWRFRRSYRFLA